MTKIDLTPELEGWRLEMVESLKTALSAAREAPHQADGDSVLVAAAVLVGARMLGRSFESLREQIGYVSEDIEKPTRSES